MLWNRNLVFCGAWLMAGAFVAACDEPSSECPAILYFSRLDLLFTPTNAGAEERFATWEDQTHDGIADQRIDVTLENGVDYLMTVELGVPCWGSYTQRIRDNGSDYQLIFQGNGVKGPGSLSSDPILTHAYADTDEGGLPIGLVNHVSVDRQGTGSFVMTLLDVSPNGNGPQKVDGLAEYIRDNQPEDWPGLIDARFELSLQSQ